MLTNRQKKILKFIVKEYTRNKKPIGSKEFCRKYFPELSSATIRREFFILTVQKYLTQPYWSAGRLPTDKTYQWYIQENLLNRNIQETNELTRWEKKFSKWQKLSFNETVKKIAILCESLTIGYLPWEQLIYKYGLKNFFEKLQELSLTNWTTIWKDVEFLDEKLTKAVDDLIEEDLQIFIGRESPITKDKNLSVISYVMPYNRRKNLLILIGPKNMICERNLNILQATHNILSRINN